MQEKAVIISQYFEQYFEDKRDVIEKVRETKEMEEEQSKYQEEIYEYKKTKELEKKLDNERCYKKEKLSRAYSRLSDENKHIVCRVILNLTGKDIKSACFGTCFNKLLELNKISTSQLARYIRADVFCSMEDLYEDEEDEKRFCKKEDDEIINLYRSMLNGYKKGQNARKVKEYIQESFLRYLSMDIELLLTGKGKHYFVDFDAVSSFLKEKNINEKEFFKKIHNKLNGCSNCMEECPNKIKRAKIESSDFDCRSIAECISRELGTDIPMTEILRYEILDFTEETESSFDECIDKMNQTEKKVISDLVYDLIMFCE